MTDTSLEPVETLESDIEEPPTDTGGTGGAPSRTRSVLVVDGSNAVRLATRKMLRREGFSEEDVHFATSGKECLEAYERTMPDLVFLAIDLPDEEGHEIAKAILQSDPRARVVITTVRSVDEDERVREAVAQGAFEVVQKPIRQQQISDLIRLVTDEAEGIDRIQ